MYDATERTQLPDGGQFMARLGAGDHPSQTQLALVFLMIANLLRAEKEAPRGLPEHARRTTIAI